MTASVVGRIAAVAARDPARVAVVDAGRVIAYATLALHAGRMAGWLRRQGIGPGDMVGLTLREEYPHLLATLALLALGCRQVTLGSRDPAAMRADLAARLRVAAVLGEREDDALPGMPLLRPDIRAIAAEGAEDAPAPPLAGGGTLLITGSGTAGEPKLIALPEAALAMQGMMTAGLGTVRFRSIGNGLNNAKRLQLHTLAAGGTEVLANNGAGAEVAEVCARHGVTRLNIAPVKAEALLAAMARPGAPPWPPETGITLAGGPVSASLRGRLVAALTPDVCVLYGTSETGPVTIARPAHHDEHPDTVGPPVPGVRVEVVDEDGRALPPGERGLVRMRSAAAATACLDDPEATARAFRDGWFHPGDAGWMTQGGALVLAGRADDMMNLGTIKIFPAEIEAAAAGFPGLVECAAFALRSAEHGDIPLLAVVAREGMDTAALLAACRERRGLRAPRRIVALDALPRNARARCCGGTSRASRGCPGVDLRRPWIGPLTAGHQRLSPCAGVARGRVGCHRTKRRTSRPLPCGGACPWGLASSDCPGRTPAGPIARPMDLPLAPSTRDRAMLRALIAEGVRQNPVVTVTDPELRALLDDPAAECSFEALGFDSLARLELCIWLQLEAGIEVSEAALLDHPGVAALAAHLAARG